MSEKKYEITSKHLVQLKDGGYVFRVEIYVDTKDDIPTPKDEWTVGSMCVIGNTHEYRWLSFGREWV